ncbi:MAG: nucleoside-triphosphatase [Nitrososphaerales archaeon]|nr:nucleoside-triphosphatase [Nitrososphaerales archaeon]
MSSVVLRLKARGVIVGGCVTAERRVKAQRVGFDVRDLTNGTQGELASLVGGLGPRVGKYRVNLRDLASVGAKGLLDAVASSELIVIDEVGPMELVSPEFRRAVKTCIDSGKPVLAVIHERMEDDLLTELRSRAKTLFEVDVNNRDETAETLGSELIAVFGAPKSS